MSATTAAIVGIGATAFSQDSGRSELHLSVEAILAAVTDAGLAVHDIDGLVSFDMDTSTSGEVARSLGLPTVRFFPTTSYGGGGTCSTVQLAAIALGSGDAEVVVCYRGLNERSGTRFGLPAPLPSGSGATAAVVARSWGATFGLVSPADTWAMLARRYMHEYGACSADFGRVTVAAREFAATNPRARFHGRPITLEEHQASRWIVEPLHLLDCCMESDGAVAVALTRLERARDLRQPPVVVAAAASGFAQGQLGMAGFYRDELSGLPELQEIGKRLWQRAGAGPGDMDLAILYDHFTPSVLFQLEALGFCARGEAPAFVDDGNLGLAGTLPVNPHGGQLGEAYIHGFNGVAEAVRQLRGSAVNQVQGASRAVVTSGTGLPTSGMILEIAG